MAEFSPRQFYSDTKTFVSFEVSPPDYIDMFIRWDVFPQSSPIDVMAAQWQQLPPAYINFPLAKRYGLVDTMGMLTELGEDFTRIVYHPALKKLLDTEYEESMFGLCKALFISEWFYQIHRKSCVAFQPPRHQSTQNELDLNVVRLFNTITEIRFQYELDILKFIEQEYLIGEIVPEDFKVMVRLHSTSDEVPPSYLKFIKGFVNAASKIHRL